jgi:outer membrane protein OmpA-like peptidoglycan-associated protein
MKSAFLLIGFLVSLIATSAAQNGPPQKIPLCVGLSVVTAISQKDGDYESIKTIEAVTNQEVRLKYSSERMFKDEFIDEEPKLKQTVVHRTMRTEDLANSNSYEQQFDEQLPELIPGTTAIGTSASVLNKLKKDGEAEIGFFIAFSAPPSLDPNDTFYIFRNQMMGTIARLESTPVMLPVIVNNQRVQLPAIHAIGDFVGDKTEFFFLDDPANPIALKWRYGIDSMSADDAKKAGKATRDIDDLQVIKINYTCADASLPNGKPATGALEDSLAKTGKADVYNIYFTFNSDKIRDESEPSLKEIADVLQKHPDWRLAVGGHTDSVGTTAYNLDLSKRRAAAVKDALVKRYKIDPARLTTNGYGASQPKDTNDTLEGRARNRRVELIKQ